MDNMDRKSLYISACLYAISTLVNKGSEEYAVKIDGSWEHVPWVEVCDWLMEK